MNWQSGTWLNEPAQWSHDGGELRVTTDANTDFWRQTHYGYTRDTGHVLGFRSDGDFTAELCIRGDYKTLYDQAGLMVRADDAHWVKAGIELWDGRAVYGSVLTAGLSDWAVGGIAQSPAGFFLRATVKDGVLQLEVKDGAAPWSLLRLAPFAKAQSYLVGPMCCSPERAGLRVSFSEFRLGAAL